MNSVGSTANKSVLRELRKCEVHGDYTAVAFKGAGGEAVGSWSICPECKKEQPHTDEALRAKRLEREREKQEKILQDLKRIGLQKRYIKKTFSAFATNTRNMSAYKLAKTYAEKFETIKETGTSLIFCGKPGTGKTHLACAIANYITRCHHAGVMFCSVFRLMRDIKSTWRPESDKTEGQVLDAYKAIDLLILDEIGVQFGSDAELVLLTDLINDRYAECKPTILISNLALPDLSNFLGERIIDRMREDDGAVVAFDWESYRGKKPTTPQEPTDD